MKKRRNYLRLGVEYNTDFLSYWVSLLGYMETVPRTMPGFSNHSTLPRTADHLPSTLAGIRPWEILFRLVGKIVIENKKD